jgi:glycosyltransferase involved in cell wall biosynthesis
MKFIVSHPSSNQFSRAMINHLFKKKDLTKFYTAIAIFPSQLIYKLGNLNAFKDINRRSFDQNLKKYTTSNPWREIGRLLAPKFKLNSWVAHEKGICSVDRVYQSHDKWVSKKLLSLDLNSLKGVYAYEDAALETFKKAKYLGLKCIYDLPIAYWETGRKLMQEEALRHPSWKNTMVGGTSDSEIKTQRKVEELKLADYVVVPSKFVKDSLPPWVDPTKIIVSPFGSPKSSVRIKKKNLENRKLRILFVGSMGQRKGLADLFEAMNFVDISKVELVVLGSLIESLPFYKNIQPNFSYESPRPHKEVLELMQSCDVFCLPSIVEGRAQVMQEAMSQGLPIIITPNTGGEDLVETGKTGFLVAIRNPKAIAEKITWFIDHKANIHAMGKAAIEKSKDYTWEKYGSTITDAINKFI